MELRAAHPNTTVLTLKSKAGRTLVLKAASVGGGRIRVTEIDGVPADFGGDSNTLIIHNEDTPAASPRSLCRWPSAASISRPCRCSAPRRALRRYGAGMRLPHPHVPEQQMAVMPGIRKVTCLNIDEPEECEED